MERNIRLITILNFCTDLVFYAPIAIIYFSQVAGSYALGMGVFSIVMISSAVFEIPTGIFSDLIGRKNTVILGSIAYFGAALALALAKSFPVLAVAAILEGVGRSFFSGNNDALLYDTLKQYQKENKYHEFSGKTGSAFQIALAISAVIGGLIANWSFRLVFWVSVIPRVGMILAGLFLKEPRAHSEKSGNVYDHLAHSLSIFKNKSKLRLLITASAIKFSFGEAGYLFRSAFFYTLWPVWAIGIASTLSNIGAAASYYLSGRIINHFKSLNILIYETVSNRLVTMFALFFPTVASPLLMSLPSFNFGVGQVAMNTLLQEEFTDAQRATLMSLGSLIKSIAFGGIAVLLGVIADHVGPRNTLLFSQAMLLTPLIIYWVIFKHEHSGNRNIV